MNRIQLPKGIFNLVEMKEIKMDKKKKDKLHIHFYHEKKVLTLKMMEKHQRNTWFKALTILKDFHIS